MAGVVPQNRGNRSATRIGSAMSRKLRTAGWNISPSGRKHKHEGIFVSAQGDHVSILVDLGYYGKNVHTADLIFSDIIKWGCVPENARLSTSDQVCFIHFEYQRPKAKS